MYQTPRSIHADLWLTVLVITVVQVQWTEPNRVFKNKHLAGRMGGNRVTIQTQRSYLSYPREKRYPYQR